MSDTGEEMNDQSADLLILLKAAVNGGCREIDSPKQGQL